jgi:peptidoglycan/LPS O-acetylase OafA/YrhL
VFATALAAVYLGSLALEWALLQRLLNRADVGIIAACTAAAGIGFAVYFLINRDDWRFELKESLFAFAGALVLVIAFRMLALRRRQLNSGPDEDLGDVFR